MPRLRTIIVDDEPIHMELFQEVLVVRLEEVLGPLGHELLDIGQRRPGERRVQPHVHLVHQIGRFVGRGLVGRRAPLVVL